MEPETSQASNEAPKRRRLKFGLIGCGGLLGICLIIGVIGAIVSSGDDDDSDAAADNGEPTTAIQATATETTDEDSDDSDNESTVGDGVATESTDAAPTEAPSPTNEPTETPAPEPTPTAANPGSGRSNPLPVGETGQTDEWEVQILEVLRGDAAWAKLLEVNQFNSPAPEGQEYILLNVRVKYLGEEAEAQRVDFTWFRSTGDARVKYSWPAVVEPEPELAAELFADAEASGWIALVARQGEGNMMAIFEPIVSFEEGDEIFMAIDEGANVQSLTERLAEENDLGFDRNTPVPIGERVVGDTWEIWVNEAIRGDEALARLKEANQFNEDPAEGMEYVLVNIGARNVKPESGSDSIDGFAFKATGDAGRVYDNPSIVEPVPELSFDVYAGGEVSGWATVQVAIGEQNIKLVYQPPFSFTADPRYFALE